MQGLRSRLQGLGPGLGAQLCSPYRRTPAPPAARLTPAPRLLSSSAAVEGSGFMVQGSGIEFVQQLGRRRASFRMRDAARAQVAAGGEEPRSIRPDQVACTITHT